MKLWLLLFAIAVSAAQAAPHRSSAERLAFQRENPCPSTGARRGGCPGYVIDHPEPLCAGGADNHKTNMAWQTIADARRKDVQERRLCRSLRKQRS